jgi:hypothetical protein
MSERELSDLEEGLKALAPAPVSIDRDQVLFRAGQHSAARAARVWRAAAVFLALTTGGLGVAWMCQPEPSPEVRIVEVPVKVFVAPVVDKKPEPPAPKSADSKPITPKQVEAVPVLAHHRVQNEMLRHGLDTVPHLPPETNPPHQLPDDLNVRDLYKGGARWPFLFSGE